jgi:hypothetical protein
MPLRKGKRRRIRMGDTYTIDEDVELEDVVADPEGTEPAEEVTPDEVVQGDEEVHGTDWPWAPEHGGEA